MKHLKEIFIIFTFQSLIGNLLVIPYNLKHGYNLDDLWYIFIYIFIFSVAIGYLFRQDYAILTKKKIFFNYAKLFIIGLFFNIFMTYFRP